ncbi:hypothetical protein C1646_664874 [Rhizophagus diaphanus]|nr:hypothetical protein C1646_664874 [Rhizophagus diaphanus] [Rhizophagus sp. MUCL 43196]
MTDTNSSTNSFDIPTNFRSLLNSDIVLGPLTPGLLFTHKNLNLDFLFGEDPTGLLYLEKDLNLDLLFAKTKQPRLLDTNKDLYLDQLFNESEELAMAAIPEGFNLNILLNTLNNLTNALGAGGNNWVNVNNAINTLNATLAANNNVLQTRGMQAAQIPTFYGEIKTQFLELYQQINDEAFAYPDNIQARKFISRLLPELYVAVKPFGDQTLQAAIDRARACELTLREGKKGASLEGKGAKPDQNPSFCTLFEAYPAQRNRPITRSHQYTKPDEEQEASPPVSNIVRELMAEVQLIPSEGNNQSSNEKEKGTILNTINPPSTSAAVNQPKKKVVIRK